MVHLNLSIKFNVAFDLCIKVFDEQDFEGSSIVICTVKSLEVFDRNLPSQLLALWTKRRLNLLGTFATSKAVLD